MSINDHINKYGFAYTSKFEQTEESLTDLKMRLMNAEESTRY